MIFSFVVVELGIGKRINQMVDVEIFNIRGVILAIITIIII